MTGKPKKPAGRGLGAPPDKRVAKKNAGSAKAQKTSARLASVQVLYQMRLNNQDAKSAVREYISRRSGFSGGRRKSVSKSPKRSSLG